MSEYLDQIMATLDWQARQDLQAYLRNEARLKMLDSVALRCHPGEKERGLVEDDMARRVAGYLHLLMSRTEDPKLFWRRWISRLTNMAIHDPTEAVAMAAAFKTWNVRLEP